ncbi:MAG: hypothetical protein GWN58_40530, partial [Anaerolineae bacterium]|nr:hypothetical protein [Anaerolineae bacterium]
LTGAGGAELTGAGGAELTGAGGAELTGAGGVELTGGAELDSAEPELSSNPFVAFFQRIFGTE